jgi:ribonuclease HII
MRKGPLPHLGLETPFWQADLPHIAGLDEAGRGAWAGPVAAAAVILPPKPNISKQLEGVRDSKQMTARQREYWTKEIKARAAAWAVGFASSQEIDAIGIVPSTRLAMQRALEQLNHAPQHLLIDALLLHTIDFSQTSIIRGDSTSLSIAAASVLAKTARDAVMVSMDNTHPGYTFAHHKGYGTRQHQTALARLGPCEIHRQSFAPIRRLLEREDLSI